MSQDSIGTIGQLKPQLRLPLAALSIEDQESTITELASELRRIEKDTAPPEVKAVFDDIGSDDVYAITNDDLDVLADVATVGAAAYLIVSAPAAIMSSLVVFLYRFRKKAIRLTAEEGLILRTLKESPKEGWTVDELISNLPDRNGGWNTARVESCLENLQSALKRDKTTATLAGERSGRWFAVDV